jgi:ubiquinone biosynthesis protein
MAGGSLLRTVLSTTRSLRTVVKDAGRAREIAAILAKYGFAAALERGGRRRERRKLLAGEVSTGSQSDLMHRAVAMLEELGPTFVKFGQILSTRPDIIPPDLALRLQSLQDHVAQVSVAEVRAQIHEGLGADPDDLFASFDETPIASASIAQVHGAVTHDGADVVVKVQRPNIRPTITADLSLLRFLSQQILDVFPEAKSFDLEGMVSEFEKSLMRELDFAIEAHSLRRFAENFEGKVDNIHIPRVFRSLSCKTVLTMDRVRGTKLTQVEDDGEKERVAQLYLDAAYQMLFQDGFFHGDLHPGNVFLEDDGRLGIIDFGMVGRLSRSMREKVVDVIFSVLREDLEGVARVWYSLGTPLGRVDYSAFESEVVEALERHAVGRPMEEIDIGGFLRSLVGVAVKHGIRLPSDFTMMFKAMVTTEGLARQVMRGINPVEAARPYIESLIKDRYSMDRLKSTAVTEAIYLVDLARELPGRVDRTLHQLEAGEVTVQTRLIGLDRYITRGVRAMNRASTAIVVASASLTGALTIDKGSAVALGLPVVSLVAFAVALAGLVWLGTGVLRGK